ncbi:MAG: hypothetical protein HY432_03610 [Candidatus Liptonbacteria bacterium]|nr:hypothetical protein [Candidatus Liptonbacteria bacterium]
MNDTTIFLFDFFRAFFTIIDILLFVFIIAMISMSWKYRPNFKMIPEEIEKTYTLGTAILREHWEAIIMKSKIDSLESRKSAVIQADKLVEDVIRRMGFEKESMATKEATSEAGMFELLQSLSSEDFKTVDRVWDAHKLRSKIVHEPDFVPSREEVQTALENYASFLKEVGVI